MIRFVTLFPVFAAFVALLFGACVTPAVAQGSFTSRTPLIITLLSEVAVDDTIIQLDQVAKLTGGPFDQRHRCAMLDIVEFKLGSSRSTVNAETIKYRLLLAGVDAAQFRIAGSAKCIVKESDELITKRKILASAEAAVRQHNDGRATDVSVTPGKSIIIPLVDVDPSDRIRYVTNVSDSPQRPGKARVDVLIVVNGKTRGTVPVQLDFTPRPSMAAKNSLKDLDILPVSNPNPKGDSVRLVVKQRDSVRIVAEMGSSRIEVRGEAIEDGRIGDVIRVRNIESNRVVSGRIEARGIVVVEY